MLSGQTQLIGKPLEGSSGQGIVKYTAADWANGAAQFKQRLLDDGIGILEWCSIPKWRACAPPR